MSDIFAQGNLFLNNPSLDNLKMGVGVSGNSSSVQDDNFSDLMEKNLRARAESANTEVNTSVTDTSSGKKNRIILDKNSKLYEQCEELEVFLLKNMLNGMRKTIQKTNLIDTGFAGQMYEDMLYDEYAKDFSENAAMGFADMAYLELTGQRGKVIDQKF
ncbi:MAG: rod-binding protein [Treponema sp.]|jgi:flagellar protein FlgJ|nr:rod-binding protein [Treponema sp.]